MTQGSTLSSDPLWQGWGELTAPTSVGGTAVFRNISASDPNQLSEGAVPLKPADGSRFVLPFDASVTDPAHAYGTSMALMNASATGDANITVTAFDESGTSIPLPAAKPHFTMVARAHQAFGITDPDRFPVLSGKRGTLVFTTVGGQLAGLGLRFSLRGKRLHP